ncbi:alpha-1,3-mannosyl-glycoprotein 4-beta-N-acetylglucosaminyltransferase A [Chrysoperla carnea]|uniref:alpha-1,3-mannosyl-glycoprotein 4-beta-N-acetylglucosaminyltransferase A n=1 Tax=Chrysoperla carnea TaxID=189513 RepID=UPI001D0959F6|nr:alpha-1,3-mannosyl-glycoprotein 4-beta-N-acetylglucosaminyltransferase A [Chrysoperla carnea]
MILKKIMSVGIISPLRRRNCLLTLVFILCVPFVIIVLLSVPDLSSEQTLVQRIAELQVKLQYLDSMYRSRQEDVQVLTQQLGNIFTDANSSGDLPTPRHVNSLQIDNHMLIRSLNMSGFRAASGLEPDKQLRLPSTFQFLPHLLDDPQSLRPAYLVSRGRTGVSVVLGVPTVHREKQSYLIPTLQNLISGMDTTEAEDSLIVVFVGETDIEIVLQVAKEIEIRFPQHLDSGLIEIISPRASYYPDMTKLRLTLGDSYERVRWRSKQNLDFAYLMSYAQSKGTFYVQLEDDILAKRNYVSIMKNYALDRISKKESWFVLDFCQLGFIGKMFKSAELPWLIQFFQMFYNDKPVDWLLDNLIATKICNGEKDYVKHCKKDKALLWIHFKPSLFQHIGTHSSLKGKVQKLKDKQFGKIPLFFPHVNPEAEIESDIKHYKQYTLKRAYLGETFFWGLLPQVGDHLTFKFSSPIYIKRYLFRSGNAEHPSDRFYNTTVEVLPRNSNQFYSRNFNTTNDGFVVVGSFDLLGVAEGSVDESLGRISILRLNVHSESENWAILSEIQIQDKVAR